MQLDEFIFELTFTFLIGIFIWGIASFVLVACGALRFV